MWPSVGHVCAYVQVFRCFGHIILSLHLCIFCPANLPHAYPGVCSKYGKAQDMTAAFLPDEEDVPGSSATSVTNLKSDTGEEDDEDEDETPTPLPSDCTELQEVEIITCGGRGCVDGLLIPASTPHGTYVLEVLDNVDPQCVRTSTTCGVTDTDTTGPESMTLRPEDLAGLCQLVPPAGSSLMSFKVTVGE